MLEPWIIEQIRRREEEERRRQEQPRLEIPVATIAGSASVPRMRKTDGEKKDRDGGNRGVVIIDM